jgi:NaMN:DMB phosphoribosyltransferase
MPTTTAIVMASTLGTDSRSSVGSTGPASKGWALLVAGVEAEEVDGEGLGVVMPPP